MKLKPTSHPQSPILLREARLTGSPPPLQLGAVFTSRGSGVSGLGFTGQLVPPQPRKLGHVHSAQNQLGAGKVTDQGLSRQVPEWAAGPQLGARSPGWTARGCLGVRAQPRLTGTGDAVTPTLPAPAQKGVFRHRRWVEIERESVLRSSLLVNIT